MRCINPLKASQNHKGDIVYSSRKAIPGLVGFEFECRKCLPCRLNLAREKAIRCWHEAKMHPNNIFLTLTYAEEHLESNKLIYRDFQLFMKSLREKQSRINDNKITFMVTGEYGEENKRPHWHAILFNYIPQDAQYFRSTKLGEKVYKSKELEDIWKKGMVEFGSVTMDSASYVARYAAKKLVHGKDEEHDYHPIHKTSSARGIGFPWIEKNYKHTFENGFVILPNGQQSKIPRYYVDWCKKNKPKLYEHYVTEVRPKIEKLASEKERREELIYLSNMLTYKGGRAPLTRNQVKLTILKSKFKRLQEKLKL